MIMARAEQLAERGISHVEQKAAQEDTEEQDHSSAAEPAQAAGHPGITLLPEHRGIATGGTCRRDDLERVLGDGCRGASPSEPLGYPTESRPPTRLGPGSWPGTPPQWPQTRNRQSEEQQPDHGLRPHHREEPRFKAGERPGERPT